ncbi:hypothetical protein JQ633_01640 [Bradyrhizobium tropiciagri]|uniref:hypothetical protein n=1 Tax=Bradyrhizobium tropiciagri TaxID=312253 RepID=UPI001BA95400|nr:hypothetical protein [Bradyrhizobium tropiciagri]MBR0869042.1 hypothetical protein [Bradyrhizobium tropiciagri]
MRLTLAFPFAVVAWMISVDHLCATESTVKREYPIIQSEPKGAFTVPERFRDFVVVCSNTPPIIELLEMAANKSLRSEGFSFSEDAVDREKSVLTLRYAMDPLTTSFIDNYNKTADKNMRIDDVRLYSASLTMSFKANDKVLQSDTEIDIFYYVGKQRKPYDGPFDKRAVYTSLADKIFESARDISCRK